MKLARKLILSIALLIITPTAYAQEKILEYTTQMDILESGVVRVIEHIVYDFGQDYRHGIFRDIPRVKENMDGKKFVMEITNIKVTDEIGETYNTMVEKGRDKINLKVGDPDVLISGIHTYNIQYDIKGALTYFADHAELYWNAIGTEWDVPIEKANAAISLPQNIDESVKFACYTGNQGSTAAECAMNQTGKNQIAIKALKRLEPGEGMTIVAGFPLDWVEYLPAQEYRTPLIERLILGGVLATLFVLNVVVPIKKIKQLRNQRKELKSKAQVVSAWFDPPKKDANNAFTPMETRLLVDKPNPKGLTGEMVYLAQKGYMKIRMKDKKHFELERLKDADGNLTTAQRILFNAIFDWDKTIVTDKDLRKSTDLGKAPAKMSKKVYETFVEEGYTTKDWGKLRRKNSIIAVISLFIGGIGTAIVYTIAYHKERPLTDKGIDAWSKAKSLKNFLASQEEQLDFQAKNQMFFEKLLPYATALGVEKIWAKRFKDIAMEQSDWYEGELDPMRMVLMNDVINHSVRSAVKATNSRSSSGFSSGFSGGFSGGGGGGGGGGSW